jgi:hypothetical protein
VISNYTGVISPTNKIPGKYTYYHVIEFIIKTKGTYEFLSLTSIDTYGCLYRGKFNSSVDPNLIRGICGSEHDGSRQFKFTTPLEAGVLYTLEFKRYAEEVTGRLSVVASGPDYIEFIPINITNREP